MCMGIPMRILEVNGFTARCEDADDTMHTIDIALVQDVRPGDHVLAFLGVARRVLDAEEAALITDALTAVEAAMAGRPVDVERAFADLVGREPQLPPHLVTPAVSRETPQ